MFFKQYINYKKYQYYKSKYPRCINLLCNNFSWRELPQNDAHLLLTYGGLLMSG